MERTLEAIAHHLKGRLIGDGTILIRGVNSLEAVREGELTFAEDPQHLARALESRAAAVIVSADVNTLSGCSGISVPNPKLAFAIVLELFYPDDPPRGAVHPSAVIGERLECGQNVDIRANAVIGDDVRIGSGTTISSGACVGDRVVIGEGCLIGPNVVLYRRTRVGSRVRIHAGSAIGGEGFGYVFHEGAHVKVPQVGDVLIEDDVEIGCNVCIDRATIGSTLVKQGTKIDNLVQIAHNDEIGKHVILAGQVGLSGSVRIGDYTVLGGKAGVVDHVAIGSRVRVGAASVVTKAIASGESVWGFPARSVRRAKEQMASVARLPSLLKEIQKLFARLVRVEERLSRLEERARPPKPRA